jgi:hypothetical protein
MLAAAKLPLHQTIQAGHMTAKAIAPHFREVTGSLIEFMAVSPMAGKVAGIMSTAASPDREMPHAGTEKPLFVCA